MNQSLVRRIAVAIVGLLLLVLFTACSGVGSNGAITLTGSISSVDAAKHSVTLNVNGQSYTINGLSDQEVQALQSQVGKTYSITVTQNSDGSYTISSGSTPTPGAEEGTGTPNANETETASPSETPGANEPGSIAFIGAVQSVSSSSIVVKMPDGSTLSMSITAQTDLSDFNGRPPAVGQTISVEATATANGSFTAAKLSTADSSDNATIVTYTGVTTQAVGSDKVIRFSVGNKSFSFTIGAGADLGDFGGNAQSIARGVTVTVKVQFSGTTGTAIEVGQASSGN
jgi:hypothetical protein